MRAAEKRMEQTPDHVVILGLGPSPKPISISSSGSAAGIGFADEVWAINALGDIVQCDRIFHMDDVRIQEIRAAARPKAISR
jgi:hypothetical protein